MPPGRRRELNPRRPVKKPSLRPSPRNPLHLPVSPTSLMNVQLARGSELLNVKLLRGSKPRNLSADVRKQPGERPKLMLKGRNVQLV